MPLETPRETQENLTQSFSAQMHDIITPLNIVITALEVLERRLRDHEDPAVNQYLGYARQNSLRLLRTVQNVTDLQRLNDNSMRYQPVLLDIGCFLKETADSLTPIMEKSGVGFVFENALPEPVFLSCDREHLERVILNLFSNAVQSLKGRGMVRLFVENESQHVRIGIRDEGCGISSERLRRILEEPDRWAGLGLRIVRRLLQQLESGLCALSEPGQGSVFWFTLKKPDTESLRSPLPHQETAWPLGPGIGPGELESSSF